MKKPRFTGASLVSTAVRCGDWGFVSDCVLVGCGSGICSMGSVTASCSTGLAGSRTIGFVLSGSTCGMAARCCVTCFLKLLLIDEYLRYSYIPLCCWIVGIIRDNRLF